MHPEYKLPGVQSLCQSEQTWIPWWAHIGTSAQLSFLKGYRFQKQSGYTSGLGLSTDWIWFENTNTTSENVSGSGFRYSNTKNRRWRTRAWTLVHPLPESYPWNDCFWFSRPFRDNRSGYQWELSLNHPSRWSTSDWYPEQPDAVFHSSGGWPVQSDTNTACPRVLLSMTTIVHPPEVWWCWLSNNRLTEAWPYSHWFCEQTQGCLCEGAGLIGRYQNVYKIAPRTFWQIQSRSISIPGLSNP